MKAADLIALRDAIAPVLDAARTEANLSFDLQSYDIPARVRNGLDEADRMLLRTIKELEGKEA